ncbi:PC-esterase domain-containing protein 1B isoform X4 [Rattus norvegicus]|uniref:PC-esterase domain-containing protein 1B isoform X4 n=1 Tax=Rattus norvegicus TaxID=10116 RepID=UPI002FD82DC8
MAPPQQDEVMRGPQIPEDTLREEVRIELRIRSPANRNEPDGRGKPPPRAPGLIPCLKGQNDSAMRMRLCGDHHLFLLLPSFLFPFRRPAMEGLDNRIFLAQTRWVPFQSENEEETVYRTAGAV